MRTSRYKEDQLALTVAVGSFLLTILVKEPRPQVAFGNVAKRLPENSPQRTRRELLMYRDRQGLSFAGG
jgi:hypothetical protein